MFGSDTPNSNPLSPIKWCKTLSPFQLITISPFHVGTNGPVTVAQISFPLSSPRSKKPSLGPFMYPLSFLHKCTKVSWCPCITICCFYPLRTASCRILSFSTISRLSASRQLTCWGIRSRQSSPWTSWSGKI